MTTLYLLENEGFHSGKDEGNITKAAHGHSSNSAPPRPEARLTVPTPSRLHLQRSQTQQSEHSTILKHMKAELVYAAEGLS